MRSLVYILGAMIYYGCNDGSKLTEGLAHKKSDPDSVLVDNAKVLLVKNKVKSILEKHCFGNSNSHCTVIHCEYDKRGNIVEWDMQRQGTIYRYVYDERGNEVMTLWVDKSDTTQVDMILYEYDQNNELTMRATPDDIVDFNNTYDRSSHLTKTVSVTEIDEGNDSKETTTRTWTSFGKISTEVTEYNRVQRSRVQYEYDKNQNLVLTTFYREDTVAKTISRRYDSQNRLIERIEDDRAKANDLHDEWGEDPLRTAVKYDSTNKVDEILEFCYDPCMSLNGHYLFKHHYLQNGLLEGKDVFESNNLIFTVTYEYEFYD